MNVLGLQKHTEKDWKQQNSSDACFDLLSVANSFDEILGSALVM